MKRNMESLQYPFSIDKGLGIAALETDYAKHVKQLIIQVLLTSPGERVNRPDFGCGLRKMVFEPLYEITDTLVQITVLESLERWLGDIIKVNYVNVDVVQEKLLVHINYILIRTREKQYLNVEVAL